MFSLPKSSSDGVINLPLKETAQNATALYHRLVVITFLIDIVVVALTLMGAQWIRFETILAGFGNPDADGLTLRDYAGHIIIGTTLMVLSLANFRAYTKECLHSFVKSLSVIIKSLIVWIFGFLTLTLVLDFQPPISRVFCGLGFALLLVVLPAWRGVLWQIVRHRNISRSLRQRALVMGWSDDFARAVDAMNHSSDRLFDVVGVITPPDGELKGEVPKSMPVMGHYDNLEALLKMKICQTLIVADDTVRNGKLLHVAGVCEKEMVDFKLVPTCFRILLSGLHLENVGGIPVLGISRLPLHSTFNQYLKRLVDILGAVVGLTLSAPIIALFGVLIYRESPGSIFYRQRRLGADGRIFEMVKLRSMKLNAEKGQKVGWTVKDDPRCLKVGAFMRKWNVDEVPQFWNVLKGDMSLVGPRPERPELIEVFKEEIPHYNARHHIKPGITGWAQINGLRGDTDLTERVRFDLHYIENWSVIFDFQIMLLTFFKREGAC